MNTIKVKEALNRFFLEDIGERDVTSQLIFPDNLLSKGTFLAKDTGVFAGRLVIEEGFKLIDERIKVELHKKDGDLVEKGEIIATVQGPIASLLTAERVILNVIQRMSGIATMTHKAVFALDSSHTRICDTRKTMPGLRMFDNRTPDEIREFSKIVPSAIVTEASGGITIEDLSKYGKTGVDYISLGALTHSVKALDISFNIEA
ncbi:nicotinate-nucleotide pyrophosphorylase [Streptococcus pneumoniae]|uniref:hypothetical protein n=1 Tax=Bacillus paranthracis TaxID=2026186 RepID=UPI0005E154B5|nr:hypothetical protein [Bacillus paranthracis]CKE85162.1 nicotinate-nucleotide pyrophosphorylase [Streptococcus pneumoniae]CKE86760.1 nicotinate-nucleotide pyrophosphorylase [Bacillus paranthracis]CKF08950.1 nicotinate-nucleotide pyrophosphorylase [Streptococcus pneumoniae]CKF21507.1 nicotinate-nucleotide pyrophosphorylase [Streptococcus pneumoniae]